jgi:putative membrane protein
MASARHATTAAVWIGLLAIGACKEKTESASRTSGVPAADSGVSSMSSSSETAQAGAGGGGLTDANIVALLDEANGADSASAAYAFGKATDAGVRTFAKMMMGEHHALRVQGRELAQRLSVTPEAPADDPLKPAAQSEMAALKAAPKGSEFDRTYIDQEIGIHKAVLDLAAKAHDQAQNADLKKLIEQAKPVIEKHLDRAEEIQKKLGKPSA